RAMAVRWLFRAQSPREQSALVEGDRELVLERAYAIARVAGGALAMVVAPAFGVSFVVVVLMVTCTVAGPGLLHIWLWRRTKTPAGRDRVRWLAVADDCMCAIFALAVFARDPMWSITLVVPLLIFVEMIRAGAPGAIIAAIAISVAHVVLTDIRHTLYGINTDPTALLFQLGLYALTLLLAVGIFRELHTLQAMRAELFGPLIAASLEFSALHDQLTGLPNRLSVTRAMDEAIAAKRGPCAVIVMHLEHFRDVRETFGHRAGDELLRHVAERVRSGLRSMDVLGHDGGGVFTIVLLGADATVAEQVARNVRGLFATPFDVVGRPLLSSAARGDPPLGVHPARGVQRSHQTADRVHARAIARGVPQLARGWIRAGRRRERLDP